MLEVIFILYVADQQESREFYEKVLELSPVLDVPGMTEFQLSDSCKLGIMPEEGIAKILAAKTPHPKDGNGIPRCELYLKVDNAQDYYDRAINTGGKEISPVQARDWGDSVGYIADPDGHIVALAEGGQEL